MSRRTWKSPYHLFKPMMSMATSSDTFILAAPFAITLLLSSVTPRQPALQVHRITRHGETEYEEDHGRTEIAGRRRHWRHPPLVGEAGLNDAEEIEDPDNGNQDGVLEQADEGIDDPRYHDLQRLRQHDQHHHLPIGEAERARRFILALGNCLKPAAHHF